MPLGDIYSTGTISVTNGSTAVTGSGVLWTDVIEGDDIYCNGLVGTIDSVGMYYDEITLKAPWQGSTDGSATYYIIKKSWNRYDPAITQSKLREYLTALIAGSVEFTPVGDIAATNVQTAIEELANDIAASPASFSAHKNGTDQTGIVSDTPTKITFPTEAWDTGSYYDAANSRWTPPPGLVHITAVVRLSAGLADGAYYAIMLYKNGSSLRDGVGLQARNVGIPLAPAISVIDVANGTDYYEVYLWPGGVSGGNKTAAGIAVWTYFQGHAL